MNRYRSVGLTLLELLVTLVIVTMAATLVLQAMRQLARVELLLEASGGDEQGRMLRREWLRALIAGTLPEQINMPLQFSGDATGFGFRSTQQVDALGPMLTPLRLLLHHESGTGRNELRLQALQAGTEEQAPIVLLSWQGEPGKIAYQDAKGVWHERWPYDPELTRRPPAMVRLELGKEAGGLLLAPVAGTEPPRARLADWIDG